MAGAAWHSGSFLRMREFLNRGVTIATTKDSVGAGCVSLRADGDIFACFGFQTGLAVTSEARLVWFCNNLLRGCGRRQEDCEREEE